MRRSGPVAITLVVLAALGGCGSKDEGVSQVARADLNPLVAQARERAAAHDAAGAERVLAVLRQRVKRLERTGDIGASDATAITHAVTAVEHRLTLVTTTTTPTTTVAPPTAPRPPGPPDHQGPGHGHKRGHDKGGKGPKED